MMMENDLMEAPEEEEEFDLMNDETFGDADAGLWEVMNIQGGHSPGKQGNQRKVRERYFHGKVKEIDEKLSNLGKKSGKMKLT